MKRTVRIKSIMPLTKRRTYSQGLIINKLMGLFQSGTITFKSDTVPWPANVASNCLSLHQEVVIWPRQKQLCHRQDMNEGCQVTGDGRMTATQPSGQLLLITDRKHRYDNLGRNRRVYKKVKEREI